MNIPKSEAYNYYLSPSKVTLIKDGSPIVFDSTHPDYDTVKKAVLNSDWETIDITIANPTPTHSFSFNGNKVTIEADEILYNGEPLQHGFVDRLKEMRQEGLKDPTPWLLFLERVMKNPSQRIRDTLHTFVEDQHMALTKEGKILAYKGVREDLYDKYSGTILNSIGSTITMERAGVDDNAENTCSNGLHVGDYDYAKSWGCGGTLLLVEFDPADAVSVPIDGQKLRTCSYKVIKAIDPSKPLTEPLYQIDDTNQIHPMSNQHPSYENAKAYLKQYLDRIHQYDSHTVQDICDRYNGLSRKDVGRLTAELDAKLEWDDEANDFVVTPNHTDHTW